MELIVKYLSCTMLSMNYKYFLYFFFFLKAILKNPLNIQRPMLYIFYKVSGQDIVVRSIPMLKDYSMVLDINSHVDRSIFFSGLFGRDVEDDLYNFIKKHINDTSVFFDIGANSGYFSLLASQISKNGFVHAFEPVPKAYRNFNNTIKLNHIKNIKLNNVCIGTKKGVVTFYVASHSDLSSLKVTAFQMKNRRIRCKMITLTDYCKNTILTKIDIMKIDTEGAERDILLNSKEILKKFKPILIVEFSNKTAEAFGYHPNDIYDFLTTLGYTIYNYKRGQLMRQDKKDFYEEDLYCIWKT